MTELKREELNQWWKLRQQLVNGYHMESYDWQELIELNHLVMEASHEIHNNNMLGVKPNNE